MVYDSLGQELAEGDVVSFPLALGQSVPARVFKIESGAGIIKPGAPPPSVTPTVSLQVVLTVIAPQGVLAGALKVGSASAPSSDAPATEEVPV